VLDIVGEWPILYIPAVLRGMGRVADCILEMWQEEASSGRLFTRCRISNEPLELPDGEYTLDFGNRSVRTHKYHGGWELNFLYDAEPFTQAA
jgi:hypothetical protein